MQQRAGQGHGGRQGRRGAGSIHSSSSSSGRSTRTAGPRPSFAPRHQAQHSSAHRLQPVAAAANRSGAEGDAAEELPLWRFLRQQGFSADGISRLQAATFIWGGRRYATVAGKRITEDKLQQNLAPNIAALRVEGLDTATVEQLFQAFPKLLTTAHATFSSSLAALRQLAALLREDPRAVQAPPGATQLGVALWLYPTASAYLLTRANLASLIGGNLQLRRQLGISDAETAAALFRRHGCLVSNFERAEALVAHLQHLQAGGELSQEQGEQAATRFGGLALSVCWYLVSVGTVGRLQCSMSCHFPSHSVSRAASSQELSLTPAEFDRRRREGSALGNMGYSDPAGRQRAAAEALGELLQAADGVPGPLQQQYQQQGEALVQRQSRLWTASPTSLRASWASLQHMGLSSSQVVAVAHQQPVVLAYNWEGEAKQRLLAWVQQELGLSPYQFFTRHAVYVTYSVATIAMRADFLRQHRPGLYAETASRGPGPLLSLLTTQTRFLSKAGCTTAELATFNRAWQATPAGRRWGGKVRKVPRRAEKI